MTGLKLLGNGEVDDDSYDSFDDWVDPVGNGDGTNCDAGIPKEITLMSQDEAAQSIPPLECDKDAMLQPVVPITPNSNKFDVLDEKMFLGK